MSCLSHAASYLQPSHSLSLCCMYWYVFFFFTCQHNRGTRCGCRAVPCLSHAASCLVLNPLSRRILSCLHFSSCLFLFCGGRRVLRKPRRGEAMSSRRLRQRSAGGGRFLQVSWRWETMPDRRLHDKVRNRTCTIEAGGESFERLGRVGEGVGSLLIIGK